MAKAKTTKKKESFLDSKAFKSFMAKLYGLGASVVIIGALFKIQHWPLAGLFLTIGLTTEALIFAVSAFDKQKEVHWERVYPQLSEEFETGETKSSLSAEIDKMLEDAKIESSMVNRLGEGLNKFANSVEGIKDVSNASLATNDYASKVKVASEEVVKVTNSYGKAADAMSTLSDASGSSKEYFEQIKTASGNLAHLNLVYEKELGESNKHVDSLAQFNESFTHAMDSLSNATNNTKTYFDQIQNAAQNLSALNTMYEMELAEQNKHKDVLNMYQERVADVLANISDAGSLSIQLKEGFTKLNENLASLNNVYGNMLSAMTVR